VALAVGREEEEVSGLAEIQGRTKLVLPWKLENGAWHVFINGYSLKVESIDSGLGKGSWSLWYNGSGIATWIMSNGRKQEVFHNLEDAMLAAEAYLAQQVEMELRSLGSKMTKLVDLNVGLKKGVTNG
jgi:hypothetical protein